MRKHNKSQCSKWGSAKKQKEAPALAHGIVNNKRFQLNVNHLLLKLLSRVIGSPKHA